MPILATVILDSGCFLPVPESKGDYKEGDYTKVGYFGSSKSISDICVKADGKDVPYSEPINLDVGGQCEIKIRHRNADGKTFKKGVYCVDGFQDKLLHLSKLYDTEVCPAVDPGKFDCILHFDSGLFAPALVKPRKFKRHSKDAITGEFVVIPGVDPKLFGKPIAHNVHVYYTLEKDEVLQFVRGEEVIWSSENTPANARFDIEILADNTTAEKFYGMAMEAGRAGYWLPNQGDPPPMCALPPCEPKRTTSDQ